MCKFLCSVYVKSITWKADSQDLFDYSSRGKTTSSFQTRISGNIAKDNETIRFLDLLNFSKGKIIGSIRNQDERYGLYPINRKKYKICKENIEKMWIVVKEINLGQYLLCEGDIVKLGRLVFQVKEISLNDLSQEKLEPRTYETEENNVERNHIEKSPHACRICLGEYYSSVNPLISPCKCNGTMKYIHLNCLHMCISSKVSQISTRYSIKFTLKMPKCEICKRSLPESLYLNKNTYSNILNFPKLSNKYIVLENMLKDSNNQKEIYYLFFINKEKLSIGRSIDRDFAIDDIYVSRKHSTLICRNNLVYIKDESSKYGTLIHIKRPLLLEKSKKLTIQAGASVISFKVKKPWSLIPSCLKANNNPYDVFNNKRYSNSEKILPYNTGIPLSIKHKVTHEDSRKNTSNLNEKNEIINEEDQILLERFNTVDFNKITTEITK